ncbi:ATP-binding protein [Haloarchaeobius amylolyticus]|uniref:ATP-binding protein n=1 Tax=Haloarchaeobius amylolyticus TaxID=1198296 RepID=A0ABD6BBX3_9EURY
MSSRPIDRTSLLQLLEEEELQDPRIRRLLLYNTFAPEPVQEKGRQALAASLAHRRIHPFKKPTRSSLSSGGIRLGSTVSGQKFGLGESVLSKHFLVIGQSGSGKTTLFYNVLSQLDVPFWCFDLKQDYRHLVQDRSELLVLPWTELKYNPLAPPPGVKLRRWAQVVSEIFGHATALLSGSKNHLLKSILELYRLYGLFEERSPPYPSFHDLERFLVSDPINYMRKTSNYRDTVLNRVEAMNLGAGTVFDCSTGYMFEDLLERDVVFEFDGLSRDTQNFLMEILLAAVYEYRLAKTHRSEDLNHVFVLDEAKQVFSVYKERQSESGIPAVDELTAKMREFGEGLIVADQEASKLTDSIKANTYTKALLPTGDRKQFTAVTESMNLTERQTNAAKDLDTGEAVVQTGNSDPARVTLDTYRLSKTVTDSDLQKRQGQLWNSLTAEPREQPDRFVESVQHGNTDSEETEVLDENKSEVTVSDDAEHLLKGLVEEPFVPLTERYEEFSSRYKGNKAKTELVESGLVTEQSTRTETGARKLLELTDRGRSYVEKHLGLDPSQEGRGGIVHRYWQHQVKKMFEEAGWAVKLELFDADVYVNTGKLELAIEVAMENTQREREHVEKHLEYGFDVIWIVCRTEKVKNGLKQRLEESGIDTDQVVFHLAQDVSDALTDWP